MEQLSQKGYRLWWFHSHGKAESDAATRARRLQRAIRALTDLGDRLASLPVCFRQRDKVAAVADAILDVHALAVSFLALMVQSLLERELRRAIPSQGLESLPLYPEGRACVRPTTRQVLDVFDPIAQHAIFLADSDEFDTFTTELAPRPPYWFRQR